MLTTKEIKPISGCVGGGGVEPLGTHWLLCALRFTISVCLFVCVCVTTLLFGRGAVRSSVFASFSYFHHAAGRSRGCNFSSVSFVVLRFFSFFIFLNIFLSRRLNALDVASGWARRDSCLCCFLCVGDLLLLHIFFQVAVVWFFGGIILRFFLLQVDARPATVVYVVECVQTICLLSNRLSHSLSTTRRRTV